MLFVGYPCLGKTTFFRRIFEPAGYMHVNQDVLKTRAKCAKAVRDILQSRHSCVIGMYVLCLLLVTLTGVDNTNRDKVTRRAYVDLAREFNVSIRYSTAWHRHMQHYHSS